MAKIGVQRTDTRRHRQNPEGAHVASMPQTRCTFLGPEFYLTPGTQDHLDSLRNPVMRDPPTTRIVQLPGN